MRSERERLLDVLEAIARIEKYAVRGKAAFMQDELIQNWMVSQITMIGEACRALPDEFQARNANIPWADIIAMRNIPELKQNILAILKNLDPSAA